MWWCGRAKGRMTRQEDFAKRPFYRKGILCNQDDDENTRSQEEELHWGKGNEVNLQFSSVQSLSRVQLIVTPWTAAHQASLSITNSRSLLKLMSIKSEMPSYHLILCRPLILLPAFNLSQHQGLLQGVRSSHQMANYWRFSISPSNEYSGLISFRIDWLDLFAVQGTLKSLLQHHIQKHQFFSAQLSL